MLKMNIEGNTIDITVDGTVDEVLAEWACVTIRLEEFMKTKGVNDPAELLRVSLGFAEDRNKKGRN